MAMGSINMPMETFIKAIGKTIKCMDKASIHFKMDQFMTVHFMPVNSMEKVFSIIKQNNTTILLSITDNGRNQCPTAKEKQNIITETITKVHF
jgi:hypothetical protein